MGTTLREIVEEIGGGFPVVANLRLHKQAVLPAVVFCQVLDIEIDYDNLTEIVP